MTITTIEKPATKTKREVAQRLQYLNKLAKTLRLEGKSWCSFMQSGMDDFYYSQNNL